jgi:PAS domain S-box-containing protein
MNQRYFSMNLLRFNALADAVSAVRKYKCQESGTNARQEELSRLLMRVFLVDGKPAVKSARLFFLPWTKVTDTSEKAVITESDTRSAEQQSKKTASRKGTVMYLGNLGNELEKTSETSAPHSAEVSPLSQETQKKQETNFVHMTHMTHMKESQRDCVEESEPTAESGAKVVATVRASEEAQLILALEMNVQLAAHVAPFFRILTTILAAKMTDTEVFLKDSVDELAELYELALQEKVEPATGNFTINSMKPAEIIASQAATALDTDHFTEVFGSLAESLPIMVWTALPCGSINFVNRKWSSFTGLSDASALGSGWQQALHPEDFKRTVSRYEKCLQTGEMYEIEQRLLDSNTRNYRWFLVQAVPVRDRKGDIRIWFGTCTDIDDQKRAHERLQFVMDTIPAAIFWKDRDSVYLGCNKNFARIAGFPNADGIVGKTDFDMPWTASETEFYHLCDRKVMEENKPQFNIIEPLTTDTGEVVWLSTSKMPMHDAAGNVIGLLGHFEDITEKMRLQSQREDFMASLAHDLKVPVIGAIRALDALLQGYVGPLDDKQLDFIRCLHRSHENLLLMVKNLLQVLRYESGKDRFVFEHFDLVGTLNECVNEFAHSLEAKHIHLQLDAPKKLILSADRAALKAVLVNLLGHAIGSAPEHTQVKVNLHSCGKQANLEVHNGGEPICEEDMEQLFHRLWQGKRFGAGAGLGLFLCRQIAEGHNGSMTCLSSREEGTVMKLTVPISPSVPSQDKKGSQRK